jgi:hypothetical protein
MATQQMANANGPGTSQPTMQPEGVAQSIQQPYIQNGLTYQSNNKFVMQRDTAGNIILDANAATMQHLIIEPAVEKILNKSVVEVFDTRFNYFKFPAKSKVIPSTAFTLNTDLDTDAPEPLEEALQDLISGHYISPEYPGTNDYPSVSKKLSLSYPSGISWTGRWGYQRVPFTFPLSGPPQITPGTMTFTPEIIAQLREMNSTVKFDIMLKCYSDQAGLNTGMAMGLRRTMPTRYRNNHKLAADSTFKVWQEWTEDDGSDYPVVYQHSGIYGPWVHLHLTYIIDARDDLFDYDQYEVVAEAGNHSWFIGGPSSYWNIQVIPNPGVSGQYGIQIPDRDANGDYRSSHKRHQVFGGKRSS